MTEPTDLYARTVRAVAVDSLVRGWTESIVARGVHPLSAAVIVTWAIERAAVERQRRKEWPA